MRHNPAAQRTSQAMLMAARAGSPYWSVRILADFDDPEALAFVQRAGQRPTGTSPFPQWCKAWLQQEREKGTQLSPLPVLVLSEDGQPVMLLPMVMKEHDGLRHVLPLPHPSRKGTMSAVGLAGPDLALSALEARAILRAVIAKLPTGTDLLTFPMPRPGTHALSWRGLFHLLLRRLSG